MWNPYGDVLLELNDEDLKSTEQLQTALQKNGAQSVSLTVKRGARTLSLEATPESGADGVYRLGAWVGQYGRYRDDDLL